MTVEAFIDLLYRSIFWFALVVLIILIIYTIYKSLEKG